MVTINRSAIMVYTAAQMFDLVNDVESYPEFMQGCRSAELISREGNELIGRLTLAKAGFSQTFTTRNTLTPNSRIDMELVEGAFRHFSAIWRFKPLTEDACKVSLHMEFEFSRGMLDFALERLFSASANSLVDSLQKRAQQVYD